MKTYSIILTLLAALFCGSLLHAVESQYATSNILTVANGGFSSADDALSPAVPIGFSFVFGGVSYTQAYISTNGVLYFSGGTGEWTNTELSVRTTQLGVYALWDDLFVGPSGNETPSRALYYTTGTVGSRVFIMQWTNWYSFAEPYEVGTFNVVLYEGSNKIDIYYRNMLGTSVQRMFGNSATIGLSVTSTYSTQYSFNQQNAPEGRLLSYTPETGGNTPYTLQTQDVTPATTAAIQTYFLTFTGGPKSPVELSAQPRTPDANSAVLTWNLSDNGQEPTGYRIRYSTNANMSGFLETTEFVSAGRTFTLGALTPGTTYFWQAVSYYSGMSSVSTTSTFTQNANTAPVAVGASYSTFQNVDYSGTLAATDVDNDPTNSGLIYSISTNPASGSAVITDSATGAFTFMPATDFTGSISFGYRAFDGTAYSNEATVTIEVLEPREIAIEQPLDGNLTDGVSEVSFSPTNLGAWTELTFTVRNTGSSALTLGALTFSGANAADFTVTTAPPATVAGNSTGTFVIRFAPVTAGAKTAAFSLVNDDGDENPFDVALAGTGVLNPPLVTTITASSITAYTAMLNGTVNPNYGASTAWFQYSTDPALTTAVMTTAVQNVAYGSSGVSVSAGITGLISDTDYYYRVVAANDAGQTQGSILHFHSSYPVASRISLDNTMGLPMGGDVYRPLPGVINEAGRITFKALGKVNTGGITAGNDGLLMTDTSGSLRVIAQESFSMPDGGSLSGAFRSVLLSESGHSITHEQYSGASPVNDYGYMISENGVSMEVISREGDSAPGGGTFTGHAGRPVLDDMDRLYFPGALSGVASTKNSGVWYDVGGTISVLAKEGQDAASLTGDAAWLGNFLTMTSAAGDGAAFISSLQNNPDNSRQKTALAANQAIFGGTPGGLSIVARKGTVIPNVGKLNSFNAVSRGAAGDHAFLSLLLMSRTAPVVSGTNDQVLMAQVAGDLHVVARENTTEILPGLTPFRFGCFYMTSTGSLIFQAWLAGSGAGFANDGILCRWTAADGIEILAREGSPAPGLGANYGTFQALSVSPGGAIALQSTVGMSVVVMKALPGATLSLVAKTGQTLSFNGSTRGIQSLGIYQTGFGSGGGGGGLGSAINDQGAVFIVLSLGGLDYVARVYR